jgi:hypothetical protein
MLYILILLNVLIIVNACHPECKFTCDDPIFPAICDNSCHDVPNCHLENTDPICFAKCSPVCKEAKCQTQCEALQPALCSVHCDPPKCKVRCPKDQCESDSCPQCETICEPEKCYSTCINPTPNCTILCEASDCSWTCIKPECSEPKSKIVCDPTSCCGCKKPKNYPKQICQLNCEKPACESNITHHHKQHRCH